VTGPSYASKVLGTDVIVSITVEADLKK